MKNILELEPAQGIPTYPLHLASEQLRAAAEKYCAAGESPHSAAAAERIRRRYIGKVLPDAVPPDPHVTAVNALNRFTQTIQERLAAEYGLHKGPVQNALGQLDRLAALAQQAGYPLECDDVRKAFMHFLMAYVTSGFKDQDTTGTQMGYYQGAWRGGGFSS